MLELTHYEILDLANSHVNNATVDINRALALGSAYLICAYRSGKELTRFQVSIINIGFLIFAGQALAGTLQEFHNAVNYWELVIGADLSRSSIMIGSYVYMAFGVGALVACIAFMWSVRHPKTD